MPNRQTAERRRERERVCCRLCKVLGTAARARGGQSLRCCRLWLAWGLGRPARGVLYVVHSAALSPLTPRVCPGARHHSLVPAGRVAGVRPNPLVRPSHYVGGWLGEPPVTAGRGAYPGVQFPGARSPEPNPPAALAAGGLTRQSLGFGGGIAVRHSGGGCRPAADCRCSASRRPLGRYGTPGCLDIPAAKHGGKAPVWRDERTCGCFHKCQGPSTYVEHSL